MFATRLSHLWCVTDFVSINKLYKRNGGKIRINKYVLRICFSIFMHRNLCSHLYHMRPPISLVKYYTVEPAHAVTCIKRAPYSCPFIENFILIESLLRGHLSYKATFSLSQRWPLNTGLTVLPPSQDPQFWID